MAVSPAAWLVMTDRQSARAVLGSGAVLEVGRVEVEILLAVHAPEGGGGQVAAVTEESVTHEAGALEVGALELGLRQIRARSLHLRQHCLLHQRVLHLGILQHHGIALQLGHVGSV